MSWCPGYFHPEKCGPKKILNCFIGPLYGFQNL